MKNVTLIAMLKKLVSDYNDYSAFVAFNREQMKENNCDETTLQWNREHMYCIETYMEELAVLMGVKLKFDYGFHEYASDDCQRYLEYRTASIEEEKRIGYWFDVGSLSCRCSECGCKNNKESNFCPECGAYMKGER